MWKYEMNANDEVSELEPDLGAKVRGAALHPSLQTERAPPTQTAPSSCPPPCLWNPCRIGPGWRLSLKNISCLHSHAIGSSSLFQKDSEFEHLEAGFILSNFKHMKKGSSSKLSGKTLLRERQAIPHSDSPHLPQALFLGCSESLYGIVPLTGRRAQANGLCYMAPLMWLRLDELSLFPADRQFSFSLSSTSCNVFCS